MLIQLTIFRWIIWRICSCIFCRNNIIKFNNDLSDKLSFINTSDINAVPNGYKSALYGNDSVSCYVTFKASYASIQFRVNANHLTVRTKWGSSDWTAYKDLY
jgi:hypothetical protein